MLLLGAFSCKSASSNPETYVYDASGIADVKIGADYSSVPTSCPSLYTLAKFYVRCGGEDGEGVEIQYFDDVSEEAVISASLDMDPNIIDALYDKGLAGEYYDIADPQIVDLLQEYGPTKIGSVNVVASPRISINIEGEVLATTDPIVKFMELPGAETILTLGEGIYLVCQIGNLYLGSYDASEKVVPEVYDLACKRIASAIETGDFAPLILSPSDINPDARFDSFTYFPAP